MPITCSTCDHGHSLGETVPRILGNLVPLPGRASRPWSQCSRCGAPLDTTWIPLLWLWCLPSASATSAIARTFGLTPLLWFLPTMAVGLFVAALILWASSVKAAAGVAAVISLVVVLLGLGVS